MVDENEGRAVLSTLEEWGELGEWTEPEAELMRREEQAAQLEAMLQQQPDPDDPTQKGPPPPSDNDGD